MRRGTSNINVLLFCALVSILSGSMGPTTASTLTADSVSSAKLFLLRSHLSALKKRQRHTNTRSPFYAVVKGKQDTLSEKNSTEKRQNVTSKVVSTSYASADCNGLGCEKMKAALLAATNTRGDSLPPPKHLPRLESMSSPDIIYTKNEILTRKKSQDRTQIADEDQLHGLVPEVRIEVTAEMESLVAELERIVAKRETLQNIEAALEDAVNVMEEHLGIDKDTQIQAYREENEQLSKDILKEQEAKKTMEEEQDEEEYLDGDITTYQGETREKGDKLDEEKETDDEDEEKEKDDEEEEEKEKEKEKADNDEEKEIDDEDEEKKKDEEDEEKEIDDEDEEKEIDDEDEEKEIDDEDEEKEEDDEEKEKDDEDDEEKEKDDEDEEAEKDDE